MEISDYELVTRCLGNDSKAFSELVTRYKRLIYSVVYNMVNDKQEINDISQEIFIRIFKSLNRYNPEYKFSTWTVKIATNYCLDVLRKKKHECIPIDEIIGVCDRADTPEIEYITGERSRIIREAVASLPDKYRIPLVLFHQQGFSYDEMTKILNEPMTIIKNRLYRARLMLRERLDQERREGIL